MYYFKKVFVLVCLSVPVCRATGQSINGSHNKLAPAALQADLRLLCDTLQKVHPGIYRYETKARINKIFDSCYRSIKDSMTVPQFFMLTNFVIAAIKDGHSSSKMPRPFMNEFINKEKIFPAMVGFINNHVFVYCCNQNPTLNGSELLAINGRPVSRIVKRLFEYIPSDAGISSRKNWEINESFPFLYDIEYGNKDIFTVSYQTGNGERKSTVLNSDVFKNISCPSPFQRPYRYLGLQYQQDGTALLTIQTFLDDFLRGTGENFAQFLDSAFADLRVKKTRRLLIDIRGNQGGNDGNGALLYSYLTSKPFLYYRSQEDINGRFQADEEHPNLKEQASRQNYFTGKVFILANGRSFSASAEFSAIARSERRALFIGEEVGGGYYGNTSGNESNVILPNSKLTCRIPLIKYTSAVKSASNSGNVIKPDFPVYATIQDLINHTDSQLLQALRIAAKN